jgi:tetratricopeptide (TPR) repeat protein
MAAKSRTSSTTSRSDSFDADELLALARVDIDRGELAEALWKLKAVHADSSPPAESFSMSGRLYAQLGLWDRAKSMFQKYLEQNPAAVTEAFQLGMVHFDAGKLAEAKSIWESLLKENPTHPPVLFYLALAATQQGDTPRAKQLLDALLKTAAPDNLYFGRSKELLQAIDTRQFPGPAAGDGNGKSKDPLRLAPKDAYKTEH